MLIEDAMKLPEADPVDVPIDLWGGFGFQAPRCEGEHTWEDDGGMPWWTVTIDGVRYRQTYRIVAA